MKEFFSKLSKISIHNIVIVITVLGVFSLATLLCFKPIPAENKETVTRALDQILALGFGAVFGYLFVASRKQAPENPPTVQ
jgi:ABC-type Na+ efflux pump permease subunit